MPWCVNTSCHESVDRGNLDSSGVSGKLPWGSEVELKKGVLIRWSGWEEHSRKEEQHVQRPWEKKQQRNSRVLLYNVKERYHSLGVCYTLFSQLQFLATLWINDAHNVLSSAALLSSCKLMSMASFMKPVHLIFGLPLFLLPSVFSSIIVFSKDPCLLMVCLNLHMVKYTLDHKQLPFNHLESHLCGTVYLSIIQMPPNLWCFKLMIFQLFDGGEVICIQ